MAPRLPADKDLQAAAARARQREQAARQRQENQRARLRWVILLLALVLLVALMADIRGITHRLGRIQRTGPLPRQGDAADIAQGLAGARYEDPAGLFSLVPLRNWTRVPSPVEGFFNVVFQGPHGMDMGIQVVVTNGLTFDQLVENLRRVEHSLAADTHMDIAYVGAHRAVKRSVQLFKNRVLMLDFLTGDLAHHVQFSVPTALYEEYEPVFLKLMQTYEPGRILPAPDAPVLP